MRFLMFGISPVYGGTEAVIYSMLEEFHKNGLDFDYIRATDKPLAKEDWLISMGSSVYHINLRKRGRFFEYHKGIDSFFDEHARKYDGVWINLQEPEGSYILKSAARHGIKERVLVAHSSDYCSDSGLIRRFFSSLSRKNLRRNATKCIAVSKFASEFAFGKNWVSNTIIINNGIDIERNVFSENDRHLIRTQLGISERDTVLISVGRLTAQKNFIFSIDVFAEYIKSQPNSKLIIVGGGDALADLVERAKCKQVLSHILFIGPVNNTAPYLSAADFFLFPSTSEGLGMALIEAQCSGLPCFASDGPIPKETEVTKLIQWISLKRKPSEWALIIAGTPKNRSRLSAAKSLDEHHIDSMFVAQKYLKNIRK